MRTRSTILAAIASALALTGPAAVATAAEARGGDASLAARMQRMEDREAIHDLLVTYGRLLDDRDLVGYSNLFAADGVWEGGIGSAKGPAEIRQMLQTVYGRVEPGRFEGGYHIMSDIMIDVTGDTASAWLRWTWVVEGDDGTPTIQRSGHYEDTLVKQGGQWLFKHRLTVTELPTAARDTEAQIFRRDHRDRK